MTRTERYREVIARLSAAMPNAASELDYTNPYELLVAVILSAQCTDKRVNMVTPALFAAYPDAWALAKATEDDIFSLISSISYPNNKTKSLMGMAQVLTRDFNGEVPGTMEQLLTLPGVGRKTANVILSIVFNQPAMAVDTHVFRVSERIGLTTRSRTPEATERTLTANIPAELIPRAHHWLILHGRYTCKARKPLCDQCILTDVCRAYKAANKS